MTRGAPEAPDCSASRARLRRGERRDRAESEDAATRQALDTLYREHYLSLVRLAALLTGDALRAERIAADSLLAVLTASPDSHVPSDAKFRLRRQVVVRSRHVAALHRASQRARPHRTVPHARTPALAWESSPVMRVLGLLSAGQREAVVLRHYLELSEQETAAVMGTNQQTVRRSLAGAMAALGPVMPEAPS